MTADPATEPAPSMRRDVVSAYAAAAAKIGSWVIVLGLVYRYVGVAEFAMLALIRGTIGILNYTSLGLAPAMIRLLSEVRQDPPPPQDNSPVLSYQSPEAPTPVQRLYANGLIIALITGAAGILLSIAYALAFPHIFREHDSVLESTTRLFAPVMLIGIGTAIRLMSDAPGSVLQAHRQIARDNWRLVEADLIWVGLCIVLLASTRDGFLNIAGFAYGLTGALLFYRRSTIAARLTGLRFPRWGLIDEATIRRLLAFGLIVLLAQLADYLYAPVDYILINRLLGWDEVAVYTPAMQIDSGLLLLVGGLSAVLLPRAALAHAAGDHDQLRRYYVRGTLASAGMLGAAGAVVYLSSPLILRLWLGDPMPAAQAILPLVLIHTIIGGSSAVGRSVLLGMGKVRPYAVAAIAAGVANVVLSYIFVKYLDLGLKGIIYGTLVAVIARAGIWMPWYVLRQLR